MNVDVLLTPRDLERAQLPERAVVVFDVLRATTTMAAALAAGVGEIRVFDSLSAAQRAAEHHHEPVLCGEQNCLPPAGFHLGNSPAGFVRQLHDRTTVFMSTTNGTRALVAARGAKRLMIGALVNAAATARQLAQAKLDVTLLCAGTDGQPAMEDLIGAGAVAAALGALTPVNLANDVARIASRLFRACKDDLPSALSEATGGRNVIAAGLAADVAWAARLDALDVAGVVLDEPLRVVRG